MRSGIKRKRSAYRSGEKIIILLRRGIVFLSILSLVLLSILIFKISVTFFVVRDIRVTGNHYLEEEEIIRSTGLHKDKSLLRLHLEDIDRRLRQNPWIRQVSLKKQFPRTLMIRIEEAVPKALLSLKGRLFLIDEEGNILQEIRDKRYRFLPVINIDPEKNHKGFIESLRLIDALDENGVLDSSEIVEIGLEPYGLFMKVDGEAIKVGYGNYSEKLQRWGELEPELRRMGVKIKYVDLRFKDIIIKPLNIAKK